MNLSLNDAAAFLIQLEPDDAAETAHLKEILSAIAEDTSQPQSFRKNILIAVQKIGEISEAKDSDRASALTEIGSLIEAAMNVIEENQKKSFSENSVTDQDDDSIDKDENSVSGQAAEYEDETEPEKEECVKQSDEDKAEPISAEPSSDSSPVDYMPENTDPELMGAFITESSDLLANAEEALLMLEKNPDDIDAVSIIFRAFHTVKGTSGFLGLSLISEIAHHAESLLSRVRDREIRYAENYPDLALRSVDILKELLRSSQNALEGKPFPKPPGYDELISLLTDPEKAGISGQQQKKIPEISQPKHQATDMTEAKSDVSKEEKKPVFSKKLGFSEDEADLPDEEEPPDTEASESEDIFAESKSDSVADIAQELRNQHRIESAKQLVESSIRVPIDRLDRFIDMVGELVVAHSMVAQDEVVSGGRQHELTKKVTHTGKIVRELQSMSMSMRMIPLKATFQKMARLVRDLSRRAGKNISFVTEGEDTEIDRNMVDYINDPLVHMVRNAVDHGIEPPEIRENLGKPVNGTVKISACHSAGNVVVEIKDDGKGLDREAILDKAVEKGFISESDVKEKIINERDILNMIFKPGFSTAKIISDVSGRGVGMDVVKTNIEALRGQIEIQSRAGKGTAFKMSLPLTLAIIDGMVLRVGSEKYVMPTISIIRSVQPRHEDISSVLGKGEMLSLQGKLIPLFRLANLFHVKNAEQDPTKAIVMVVEDDTRQAGLVIDELIGTQQIVIKTLGEMMRNIPGISGSAIMPDGRVGLILDVGGLVRLANQ